MSQQKLRQITERQQFKKQKLISAKLLPKSFRDSVGDEINVIQSENLREFDSLG